MVTCSALYRLEEEEEILRELLRLIAIKYNFFTPTIKLRGKCKRRGKAGRLEDIDTPYGRIMAHKDVVKKTEVL